MKTASIRDVRHDFNRILAWVEAGEEVTITRHRLTVARLLPARTAKKNCQDDGQYFRVKLG